MSDISISVQVLGLTSNVRKMFKDMDEALYEECRLNYEAEEVDPFLCSTSCTYSFPPTCAKASMHILCHAFLPLSSHLMQRRSHDGCVIVAGSEVCPGGAAGKEVAAVGAGSKQAAAQQRQPDRECRPMTRRVAVAAGLRCAHPCSRRCGQCCSHSALPPRLLATRELGLHRGVSTAGGRL